MPYQVAKEIMAYCTSCRMNLVHVIVALDGERIARVLCKSCNKEHNYRPPKGLKEPSSGGKASKPSAGKKTAAGRGKWAKEMEQGQAEPAKAYSMDGVFGVGDKLDHAVFGVGFVKKLMGPKKMEVLFEDGIKVLVRGPNS
ncbi:MAG: hypothetical protein ACOWYE_16595 [Desulfatiglandales bacterium]